MEKVAVRTLGQRAHELMKRVRDGETVQLTERGEAVAVVVPIPREKTFGRLVARGKIRPAEGDLLELGPPAKKRHRRSGSPTLAQLRREER